MKKICSECGNEYEANTINLLGEDRVLSPYCIKCRKIKRAQQYTLEKQEILRQEKEQHDLWMKQSGIPIRFYGKSFDDIKNYPNSNILKITELSRTYADEFPLTKQISYHSFAMFSNGVWGVGKSHLACAIAQRIMERWNKIAQCPVYYTSESGLMLRIRSTFNREKARETEDEVYEHLTHVPLLIIDDVGKEEVSDPRFVQRVWFHLVNERYDNMLPVVLTANLSPDGLVNHFGGNNNEAVFDRLLEMFDGVIWEVTGESYRRKDR